MSEADLIARIQQLFPRAGDDAAVIGRQLITTDMLVENIDFTAAVPLRSIARKSLAVNLSDIAAMGGQPRHALVALAIPETFDGGALVAEFAAAAQHFGIEIVGGDLSSSSELVISVTLIGESDTPLLRSGARPGDRIYVSRPLGASAAGLRLLQNGWSANEPFGAPDRELSYSQKEFGSAAIRRHLEPEPEVALGLALHGIATACIDISDGLSTDLNHLCSASNVGADVARERIPLFSGLLTDGVALGVPVAQAVLDGGEEYALLFTSPLRESEVSARVGRPVYAIGRTVDVPGVRLDGQPMPAHGWDHFRDR